MPERSAATISCERSRKGGRHEPHHRRVANPRPAFWVADERTDRDDTSAPSSSAAWALLEALAHVGALIDPGGVLAGQCFRRIREPERRPRLPSSMPA